jgi:hypothetical protein
MTNQFHHESVRIYRDDDIEQGSHGGEPAANDRVAQ